MEINFLELLGYLGSALTILSMLMASLVKLRVINTIGNLIGGVYAVLIGSYPVALMNLALIIINVYSLAKLFKPEKHYDFVVCKVDDGYLRYFLKRWKEDLKLHFPEFDRKSIQADKVYLACCNGDPAGLIIGKQTEDGVLDIALDYSTPTYRDCSVAQFLHSKLPETGIHTLLSSQSKTKQHIAYLDKMNFVEENGVFVKKLS